VVNTCLQTKDDLYYNVIRRESMDARFPSSRRTYTRLKDMEVCGGDLNMARAAIVSENSVFWNKLIEARKNPAAQAMLIGTDIVFKMLFRRLTIEDVIQRVAKKLGIKGRAIVCPFPEIGMDVDKPHQLEIMRAHLSRQTRRAASTTGGTAKRPSASRARPPTAKKSVARRGVKPKRKRAKKVVSRARAGTRKK
jgi:hypothetical protein